MNRWTKAETEFLKENYNVLTNKDLVKCFPDRTFISIYKKARKLGLYKEEAIEHLNRSGRRGEKSPSWKGGRKITSKGYAEVLNPSHPRADSNGYVLEHILVFEQATGIKVTTEFDVHHLDGNKLNNDISNLCLMTHKAHTSYHNKQRRKNQ